MFKFLLGVLVSTTGWFYFYNNVISVADLQIMTDQNELLLRQQDVLNTILDNCQNRNWLELDEEVYVCMHVNQMFNQLSHPPTPNFREKSENDA